MISLCTVVLNGMEDYLRALVHSVALQTQYVREIIVVKIDETEDKLLQAFPANGIWVTVYGHRMFEERIGPHDQWDLAVCGHALGLHQAIERAKGRYVWLCDPDVFFLSNVDKTYLGLIEKYNLNVVGASHFNWEPQSYLKFPCAINLMCERKTLPGPEWLKGCLYVQDDMWDQPTCNKLKAVDGKYLIPGSLPGHAHRFPNPLGIFDAGCNLWLWNLDRGGRWLGFHLDRHDVEFANNRGIEALLYPMNYSLSRYSTNFGLADDLGDTDLFYHRTGGSKGNVREKAQDFLHLYHSLFGLTPKLPTRF